MKRVEVELTFPGELRDDPIFYHIIKKFNIVPNILEASFSTEHGWAIVTFEGEDEEMVKLFEFLRARNITINVKRNEKVK